MRQSSGAQAQTADRLSLRRQAIYLQSGLIAYNIIECSIALVVGHRIGSIALFGFGLDGTLEIASSIVVLLHLKRNGRRADSPWDQRVAQFIGVLLLILAFYVFNDAMLRLILQTKPTVSFTAMGLALLSLLVMFRAARAEHEIASGLQSAALEAESRETAVCAWLSVGLLLGLGFNALFGMWWVDPTVALVMAVYIAKEGVDAVSGREAARFELSPWQAEVLRRANRIARKLVSGHAQDPNLEAVGPSGRTTPPSI